MRLILGVTFELLPFTFATVLWCAMATATGCEADGPSPASLAQQLDEVQLLEAMAGREGEFKWHQDDTGHISGVLQIFLHLEQELEVCVVRRERKCAPGLAVSTPSSGASQLIPPHPSPPLPNRPSNVPLNRSSTCSCIHVSHLPPVSLHFNLPPDYPVCDKPIFTLSCRWLNFTQLTTLCQHLDTLWNSDPGSVVLYNWQQFLTSDLLSTLNISSKLTLQYEDPATLNEKWDKRAVQEMAYPSLLLPFLLDYDKEECEREFAERFFDCEICFSSLPGSKCKRIEPCHHTHCCDCLRLHIMTKIGCGDVTKINCPSGSCEEVISLNLIQELVSSDAFERFDRLLLQKTLDKMTDVVYCPRPSCRCVTLRDEDGTTMARCPRCHFSFCTLCKHAWHGVSPCKLLPQDLKALRETWATLDTEERHLLEQQYGKNKLETAFQEYDSLEWIDSNAQKCPHCQAKIQKALGCNKMTCTHCHSNFCWLCSATLPSVDPYKHFRPGQSECAGKLFEGITDFDNDVFW